ncbi:putative MFS-type transporter YhjX [Anaerohalosphaera lusitana]|uniref:Putative MFS-type transporter YhjX n=1 Tax=Anaerohalosphaera lusitana TaxID=1936003 RepID=A0A1U9NPJ8_9BACT|nr:MFS transporter [Anaerohalosphaera lusitana]AQT69674.1 putative MFS-type transporter YhjX [Anaerohalosphaera lusitana]
MKNRWVVLAAGIVIQIVLGGVYAWSTFTPALVENYGLDNGQCGLIFGLIIAVFTVAMTQAGRVLQKKGPKLTAGIGGLLFLAGYFAASFSGGNFIVLLLSLGVVAGAGIGFGYVCPLSVGMKWFPNNKGLVTGIAVAGFGGGAIAFASGGQAMLDNGYDVLTIFRLIGLVLGGLVFAAAMLLAEPDGEKKAGGEDGEGIKRFVFSRNFGLISLGMFAGTFAGLLVVGNLKSIGLWRGLTAQQAVFAVSLYSVGNAIGRITWGQIHDRFGYRTIVLSLSFMAIVLAALLVPMGANAFVAVACLIGFGFGACFVVYAATVVNEYGTELFAKLYPICFLGYGLAGLVAPGVGGRIYDVTQSYSGAVVLSAVIVVAATGVIGLWLRPGKQLVVESGEVKETDLEPGEDMKTG